MNPAALGLGLALLALPMAADGGPPSWNPHVLILTWQDGDEDVIATSSPEVCTVAMRALATRLWQIKPDPPLALRCRPGDGFLAGHDCIAGHNCAGGARR